MSRHNPGPLADLRAFTDDQPGAGALGIIFSHHVGGDVAGAGPESGSWRHDDAIVQR